MDIVADMLFLLDSSSVVPQSQYQRELDFLKKIVELFTISPHYVRAGIIPFGDRAELSIRMGHHSTNEAINRSIDSLPYIGGNKRMDRALTLANLTFSEARPKVPKILLIITSGGDEAEPGADLSSPVGALREQGVAIFVIAIGVSLDYLKLNQIVPRKNLIVDKTYKALEPYLPFAASYIRVNSGKFLKTKDCCIPVYINELMLFSVSGEFFFVFVFVSCFFQFSFRPRAFK